MDERGGELRRTHPWMDKYVARCSRWDWHDGSRIDVVDGDGNVTATLDPVQTWIFHEADGGRTVRNLLEWSAAHYRGDHQAPPDLDATNLEALRSLVEDLGVVTLCDDGPVLQDPFLFPRSEL